jgi:hypothetical protein
MSANYYNNRKPEAPNAVAASGGVKIDGFQQVYEMLEIADPAFRESILTRLERRNRSLAAELRRRLAENEL